MFQKVQSYSAIFFMIILSGLKIVIESIYLYI
jgi:hypothetical protein